MKTENKTGAAKVAPKKSREDINRDGQARMNAELDALAQSAGWEHWSDFRKAVRRKEVSIPQKRA